MLDKKYCILSNIILFYHLNIRYDLFLLFFYLCRHNLLSILP